MLASIINELLILTGRETPAEALWPATSIFKVYTLLCRAPLDTGVEFRLVPYGLVGLVVRRPPRERKVPGSNPAGSSDTSDLKIGTPVATLPGAWRYRVSTGTGRPGVSIL